MKLSNQVGLASSCSSVHPLHHSNHHHSDGENILHEKLRNHLRWVPHTHQLTMDETNVASKCWTRLVRPTLPWFSGFQEGQMNYAFLNSSWLCVVWHHVLNPPSPNRFVEPSSLSGKFQHWTATDWTLIGLEGIVARKMIVIQLANVFSFLLVFLEL